MLERRLAGLLEGVEVVGFGPEELEVDSFVEGLGVAVGEYLAALAELAEKQDQGQFECQDFRLGYSLRYLYCSQKDSEAG